MVPLQGTAESSQLWLQRNRHESTESRFPETLWLVRMESVVKFCFVARLRRPGVQGQKPGA
jgi:hypothetical protein